MTNEEIKFEKEKLFDQIKDAEEKLSQLRQMCKHEKTFVGKYSWRPGVIIPAELCEYCGEVLRLEYY